MQNRVLFATICLVLASASGLVAGETQEIRFAEQTSMGYVQFNILERQKLLEKHAGALGLAARWSSGPWCRRTP